MVAVVWRLGVVSGFRFFLQNNLSFLTLNFVLLYGTRQSTNE